MNRGYLTSRGTPIVFAVDDDISVRESLEWLIRFAGWQPQTFASAQEFLSRRRVSTQRGLKAPPLGESKSGVTPITIRHPQTSRIPDFPKIRRDMYASLRSLAGFLRS